MSADNSRRHRTLLTVTDSFMLWERSSLCLNGFLFFHVPRGMLQECILALLGCLPLGFRDRYTWPLRVLNGVIQIRFVPLLRQVGGVEGALSRT